MMTGEMSSDTLEHLRLTACNQIPKYNTVRVTDLILSMRCFGDNWHLFCLQILQNSGLQQQQQQQQHNR